VANAIFPDARRRLEAAGPSGGFFFVHPRDLNATAAGHCLPPLLSHARLAGSRYGNPGA